MAGCVWITRVGDPVGDHLNALLDVFPMFNLESSSPSGDWASYAANCPVTNLKDTYDKQAIQAKLGQQHIRTAMKVCSLTDF